MFCSARNLAALVALSVLFALPAFPAHADFTFVQISDTHINARAADSAIVAGRYEEVIKRVNALNPAFVIHTGDAMVNLTPESLALFKQISAKFKPPLYVVPGNHDVNDKPGQKVPVSQESYDAWVNGYGPGHVAFEHEGWMFIGLTSVLFSSGLAAEKEQYDWLKTQLDSAAGKSVMVFMHHPIFENSTTEGNSYSNIDEPIRSQLLKLFKEKNVKAELYGHLHRFNESYFDGMAFIATPSTSFSVVDDKALTGYRVFKVSPTGFTTYFVDLRTGGEPPKFGGETPKPQ